MGLPNAGKSSLLARLTRARPKVADYPFTTTDPALGTIDADDRQVVVADIPGLIEGAGEGAGLGHEFLAHVERTRLLVHVLDLAPADGSDPELNHPTIERELERYGAGLERRPRLLCLSKADLVPREDAAAAVAHWVQRLGDRALAVIATSSATGLGIDDLRSAIVRHVPREPAEAIPEGASRRSVAATGGAAPALAEHRVYRPGDDDGFRVERTGHGAFRVIGGPVERLIARHDLDNQEALRHVEERLRALGVVRELEANGFEPGDDVEVGGVVFELEPGAPFR